MDRSTNRPTITRRNFLGQAAAGSCAALLSRAVGAAPPPSLDFRRLLRPAPRTARFEMDGYFVWCGTMTRGDDGLFHLFFSRWPKSTTFRGWVSHSEVGHAVAEHPTGPYRFKDLALRGSGTGTWDRHMIHNPTVLRAGGKYHLYYTGTQGNERWAPGVKLATDEDYWVCRNNQRIGVAVADSPDGPWTRMDHPLIDVSPSGWDSLITTNPTVTATPDGRFLMVYKAAGPGAQRTGRVVHGVAFADSPLGPFQKCPDPVFTHTEADFPAEDPYVWHQDDRYYAILKDMQGVFTKAGKSLALFESPDGIAWRLAEHPLASTLEIPWAGGDPEPVKRLERPQLYIENGRPAVLFCAVTPVTPADHSFNVHIPLAADAS